ncbi:MAG: Mov34/MPN/PAD-1 family protein [Nitrospinota bacterium]
MLRIPRSIVEAIFDHARQEAERECCGLLAGKDGLVTHHYPATNADGSPTTFSIESQELFQIHRAIGEAGLELLSVYHSHPMTRAYPSATDVNHAFWEGTDLETYPRCIYLIVSLAEEGEPVLRGFRIPSPSTVEEVPVTIVEDTP